MNTLVPAGSHLKAMITARDKVSALMIAKIEERVALEAELANLATEVEAFDRYLTRHGFQGIIAQPDEVTRWRGMTRPAAIIEALRKMKEPSSPKEISGWLHRMGRDDHPDNIGRALDRLRKQHRAEAPRRGLWVLSEAES